MQCETDPAQSLEEARPFLEELAGIPLVKGARRIIQYEPDPQFCLSPDFIRGVQLLPEYGWSFDLCISHGQLKKAIQLMLRVLARLPNVVCRVSGLVTEANPRHRRREDLRPHIEQVLDCFGFQRVACGGDWPVLTLAAEYRQWWQALIYHDNAVRLYRLQEGGRP